MGDEPLGKLFFFNPTLDKYLYTLCNVSARIVSFVQLLVSTHPTRVN